MELFFSRIFSYYNKFYHFIAVERLKRQDTSSTEMHTLTVSVLTTSILMWAHSFVGVLNFNSPIPGTVGVICSIVHLSSLYLYRFTNNTYLICNIFIASGMIFQATFSFYSGGFMSSSLIWFGILPLLAGIICGKKGALTWSVLSGITSIIFLIMHLQGYAFPYEISRTGKIFAQALIILGWISLSTILIVFYSSLRESTESSLIKQGNRIDDLFRVLFHDLANPLGRIAIGLSIAKKQDNVNRGLDIANLACDSMLEITKNIRQMYAATKGKAQLELIYTPLTGSVNYVNKVFTSEKQKKNIKLKYSESTTETLTVLVEPVGFRNQVLSNIISNAIKFSRPNSIIFIHASLIGEDTVSIEIKDQGIGIPSDLLGQLFDLSKNTTRYGTEGESGTGFGMHIMKSFVDLYGGKVQIDSTEQKGDVLGGTTITLTLRGKSS